MSRLRFRAECVRNCSTCTPVHRSHATQCFFISSGVSSAAIMAHKIALLGFCILGSLAAKSALAITDADIMNFALNLECLEATYYSTAVNGFGLNATTLGGGPQGVGGGKATLSPDLIKIATELANDEIDHVSL